MKEVIICSAVKYGRKIWYGHRHQNAMEVMQVELGWKFNREQLIKVRTKTKQGFITSKCRFVDRKEAMKIHIASGIKPKGFKNKYGFKYHNAKELYSEDLY